ncbi:MAG: NADPH:quinone oxidoreductase family protein [Pleurocapsa minor GSE-CHR-MK-17-07R]|jgi:NADPH:quinone reductase-like Zn-dependent oxidoreductase|nr:NADPH:quinone oxidoreductase family protein [Pleurocapsa minor GSE-CHR-MK 17-07R]
MKAVQFYEFGAPDVLRYEDAPVPAAGPGQVLIRVQSASVNYSDVARRGNLLYPFPTALPFRPGAEVAGTIEALGAGVEGLTVGMPVFALVGAGSEGYAQFAVTYAAQVIPLLPGVSMDQAAALPVAGTTAIMILKELARIQPGESVLIQGAAGGVGSYAVQLARIFGAGQIIGATSSPDKFQAIRDLGADAVVDYTQPGWADDVRALTGGKGVDIVLEMGGGDLFAQGLMLLAPFGRSIVYGVASGDALRMDEATVRHFFYNPSLNQSIHVFNLGIYFGLRPQAAGAALAELIGYVASGQVKVPVHHVLPLSQAAEAHRLMESRRTTGKIVLKPWLDA